MKTNYALISIKQTGSRRIANGHYYHCKCAGENSDRFLHFKRDPIRRGNKVCPDCVFAHRITRFFVMKVSRVRFLGRQFHLGRHDILPFEAQRCNSLCNFLRKIDPAHAKGRNTTGIGGASFASCNPVPASKGCCERVWARNYGRVELMTFCDRVGVNGTLYSCEKDVVFNQKCGITSTRLQPRHSVGVRN